MMDDWNESTLKYNDGSGPTGVPFNKEGQLYGPYIGNTGWLELDVTDLVREWADGSPNKGFFIRPYNFNGLRKKIYLASTSKDKMLSVFS